MGTKTWTWTRDNEYALEWGGGGEGRVDKGYRSRRETSRNHEQWKIKRTSLHKHR